MLIGARFIQGAGGAIASAVILGMIVTMFPEPREQAKAIGVFSFVASAGASIGLLAGGVLTEAINWHWIFFVNLPVGVAVALLARAAGRGPARDRPAGGRGRARRRAAHQRPDAVRVHAARDRRAGLGIDPDARARRRRRSRCWPRSSLRQARIPNPLMPLRLFRSRNVTGANAVMGLLVVGFFRMFFLGALYMQEILDYSPLGVGLAFLPSCIVMGTLSLRLRGAADHGRRRAATLIAGLCSRRPGCCCSRGRRSTATYVSDILPVMLLLGTGAGLAFPALMTLAMSGATPSDSGLASGLVNTTTQVGGAIGLAVLATLATERTDALRADGVSRDAALNSGFHLAYLVGAALVAVAIVVALRWCARGAGRRGGRGGRGGRQTEADAEAA